jgi:hypothetical protein
MPLRFCFIAGDNLNDLFNIRLCWLRYARRLEFCASGIGYLSPAAAPKVWGDDTPSNWWGPMTHGPNRAHDTQRESDEQAQSILVKK